MMLILLLATLIPASFQVQKFFFHTSITCRHQLEDQYNYRVQFFKRNSYWFSDKVTPEFKEQISRRSGMMMNNATYEGVYNDTSNNEEGYILSMMIGHDCLTYSKFRRINVLFTGMCKSGAGDCHLYVDVDITDLARDQIRTVRIEQGI